ncbi:MAG: hypothetical protein IKT14_08425 [Clostridiales bacterium]|nr:hypothetical protein [Clostridiales bacterium]MBR6485032.1 hypothetical protein [Clostridiales bacterium]
MADCDKCMFYNYDEITDGYYCDANIDEDEFERLQTRRNKDCPFFRPYDEYQVVKHQI